MSKVEKKAKTPAKKAPAKKGDGKAVKNGKGEKQGEKQGAAPALTPEERRLEALKPTQFQPGVSGNPNGRPPGKRNFETVFKVAVERYAIEYLAELNKGRKKNRQKELTMEEAALDPEAEMVMAQIGKARRGDTRAFEALMKFQHPQKHQHSGDRENPLLLPERQQYVEQEVKRIFTEWGAYEVLPSKEK